jgi:hypothetical protein
MTLLMNACALQEEDCAALRSALHILNDQLATLASQQQQRQQKPRQQVHTNRLGEQPSNDLQLPQQQQQQQEEVIARQKQELARQQQELAAAAQQLQEVCSLLALKNDSLSHLTRHSSMLETQVCVFAFVSLQLSCSSKVSATVGITKHAMRVGSRPASSNNVGGKSLTKP